MNPNAAPGEVPALIQGKSGEFAMTFFESVWKHSGEVGVKTFESEINLLSWSVRKDEEWELAQSPLIPLTEKNKIVTNRIKKLGLTDFFISQILILAETENLSRLNQIRYDYGEIMRAYRREIDVTLVTKTTLPEEVLEFYKRTIRLNFLTPQDNIIFTHRVDPTITKGYKIELAGQHFDYTWNKDMEAMERKYRAKNDKLMVESQATLNEPLPDYESALKVFDPDGKFPNSVFQIPKPKKIKLPELLGGIEVYKFN